MARLHDSDGNLLGGLLQSGKEGAAAARLLERVYVLSDGDTRRPVDLQTAGRDLGLSIQQTMPLLSSLVAQGCLQSVKGTERVALYLTPTAVKKMASAQTRP